MFWWIYYFDKWGESYRQHRREIEADWRRRFTPEELAEHRAWILRPYPTRPAGTARAIPSNRTKWLIRRERLGGNVPSCGLGYGLFMANPCSCYARRRYNTCPHWTEMPQGSEIFTLITLGCTSTGKPCSIWLKGALKVLSTATPSVTSIFAPVGRLVISGEVDHRNLFERPASLWEEFELDNHGRGYDRIDDWVGFSSTRTIRSEPLVGRWIFSTRVKWRFQSACSDVPKSC